MTLLAPFGPANSADEFGEWPQWRKDMGLGPHRGKDWNGLPFGTPIPASGAGVVTWRTNFTDSQAERTDLGHRNVVGYPLGDGRTIYLGNSHLAVNSALNVGDPVVPRQTIALLGNSGLASAGAHLHQTASWTNGDPGIVPTIDPMQFFTGSASAGGGSSLIEIGDLMKPIVIFGPVTGAKFPYLYDPYTGERHFLEPVELSVIRESKQGITEMTLGSQAEFDAIKKRPGSR